MDEKALLARLERLESEVGRLWDENETLKAQVEFWRAEFRRLQRENERLRRENRRLRKKLGTASTLPPETPRAFIKPKPRRKRKGPGRPEGHEGVTRPIPERVDEEVVLKPEACSKCDGPLEVLGSEERYVEEVETRRVTRKFQVFRCVCPRCSIVMSLPVPGAVPHSRFGIRLHTLVGLLRSLGLPHGRIQEFLMLQFGLKITEAALVGMSGRVARLLGPEYERLKEEVRSSAVVEMDETSWPVDGENQQLWCAVSKGAAVYAVRDSRGSGVPKEILGKEFGGVLVHDGWTAYLKLDCPGQQCLVHVNRRIQRFEVEKGMEPRPLRRSEAPRFTRAGHPPVEFIGFTKKLRRILRDAIDFHEEVEGPRRRRRGADRFQRRLDRLIEREYRDPHADQLAGGLRKCRHQMFNFLRYPGVPWHSNGVEREIRPMVVVRRNSHGSKSWAGAEATAILVSVKESCRRSGRNFLELLEKTLSGCARGRPVG